MNSPREAACASINRTAHKDTAALLAEALNLAEPTRALFVAAARGRGTADAVLAARQEVTPGAFAPATRALTVGDGPAGRVIDLRAAEVDVLRWLPIQAHTSHVWLTTGHAAPGSWQTVAERPLAG